MSIKIESGESAAESQYKRKTDAEINEMAKQGYRGELFFSWQLKQHELSNLSMIFMPLMFLSDIQRKEMIRDEIHHFYAPMKDAGPMALNGLPMFYSMGFLSKEDGERIHKRIVEIMEMLGDYKKDE